MAWTWQRYANADALHASLADALADACREGIARRGAASLALAGGRTPFPAYRMLARMSLPWAKISIVATDERCVPHDHPACNTAELKAAMASAAALDLQWLTPVDGNPDQAESHARDLLAGLPAPFDAVLLGMGADAHTASLFPGAVNLHQALVGSATAYRIDPLPLPPDAPYARVTLGLQRLLCARELHLAVTGECKRAVLDSVLEGVGAEEVDYLRQPIAAVLHASKAHVQIHWSP